VELQSHQPDFAARNLRVVAISVDPVDKSQDLAREKGLSFALLSDPEMKAIRAYGVADESNGIAWPAEFLVEKGGRIVWRDTAKAVAVRPSTADILNAWDAHAGRARVK
jgi:peroxiredoxin